MSPVSNEPAGSDSVVQGPDQNVAALKPADAERQAALRAERQAALRAERQATRPGAPSSAAAKAPRSAEEAGPVLKAVPSSPPPSSPKPAAAPAPAPASPKPTPAPPVAAAEPPGVKPAAKQAGLRLRHRVLAISFVVLVLLPIAAAAYYLWEQAADEYASTVGFSVRREDVSSAMDLLGGISALSKSSSSDTDILYEFLKSQKLVADMDTKLNLRAIWSKPQGDPVFAFDSGGSIEDLVDYWGKMVRTSYDSSTGLIDVRVLAFTPEDATRVAQALFDESSDMINSLSTIAREDAIHYSEEELKSTQDKLREARVAVTKFRTEHQIVDPSSDLASHAGILNALESQLTEAQIEIDLLGDSTQANDPRLVQAKRRVEVIQARIATERDKVGMGPDDKVGDAYAAVVGDYERLSADMDFAQRSYIAALAAYDGAQAEAQRKTRYLAAHILPTKAEVSRYPARGTILSVIALFLFLAWAIGVLITYSLRDRR